MSEINVDLNGTTVTSSSGPAPSLDQQHASKMDQVYRTQRHIYDLTRKYYLLGRDTAIARLALPRDGSLLEVACGTGRNLICAERLYPVSHLYGFDISNEMLEQARLNFRGRPRQPDLRIADASAFTAADFPVGTDGFDRIMISYALSMIPEWQKAIACSLNALKPGGALHVVDFGQQEGLPRWFRHLLHAWLARFHVTPRADLRQELAAQAEALGATLTFTPLYRGYAWHAVILRPAE
ncbi:S-adenosylmethionine-diacylgycerolhomoserine-N-methyltransferase [Rhizobium taibaishanense]|uniref:S-adenosylmethionine-diacylgycerolhomoserine-N-methyltransferase n=2 Tax=Allorhizobium taibaishanense TaxID=887144 RepID=A0A7W6HJ99_9HYPH|nr:S-adenosylmethionine-diacylgycerolhomoserine-N-methyltransferase [Allorhizobium taibaishanense]